MADIHKSFALVAVTENLGRKVAKTVTVNKDETKGIKEKIEEPYEKVEFTLASAEDASKLWTICENAREDYKDADGNDQKTPNALDVLLTYAYDLTVRQRVRQNVEGRFEDPDKGVRKVAEMFVKMGKFKTIEKAIAFVKATQETDDEEGSAAQ